MHTTIYSISESPKDENLIWVGTDDGNVQLTRDGGKTWTNVVGNVPGLPKNPGSTGSRPAISNPAPPTPRSIATPLAIWRRMFIKTTDFGKTWTPLVTPQDAKGVRGYAHVIKEDMVNPNLLFLGTEFGLWFRSTAASLGAVQRRPFPDRRGARSCDSTARQRFRPRDPRPRHLDHRRHHAAARVHARAAEAGRRFVSARPSQQRIEGQGGWPNGAAVFIGDNPPDAAVITYYQRSRHLFGKLKIEILDAAGRSGRQLPASKRRA